MILYHESLEVVSSPQIMARAFYRPLVFGTGFYTTSSKAQARRWVANRLEFDTEAPCGFINVYAFNESAFAESGLKRLDFRPSLASVEWFLFVMQNYQGSNPEHGYDLVTGPVANDRVYTEISAYEAGYVDETDVIVRLKNYRLANQFLFHTDKALQFLRFVRAEEVPRRLAK